ncbi:MAG: DNA gyrase modulator, partial [Nitrospirota bacterium]
MIDLALHAVDAATGLGAAYADGRLIAAREQSIITRNGEVSTLADVESTGIGVRVIVNDARGRGAWGFAATAELTKPAIEAAAREAVAIARASALAADERMRLVMAPQPPVTADWRSPATRDPFDVSLDEKIGLLMA